MKVLALCTYPVEAAATRYRVGQFVAPLSGRGIDVTLRLLLDSHSFASLYQRAKPPRIIVALTGPIWQRVWDVCRARHFDVVFVQREAMLTFPYLESIFPVLCELAERLFDVRRVGGPRYARLYEEVLARSN